MKILFVASECNPLVKVGGLADVIGALPKALKELGIDVSVLIPFYQVMDLDKEKVKLVLKDYPVVFNNRREKFNLFRTYLPNTTVPVFLIENGNYFKDGVYIETDASSGGSEEEAARFLFLSKVAVEIAGLNKTDILHCHDWHTAIVPFLVRKQGLKIKTLLTIHNLGYQGIYDWRTVNKLLGTDFSEKVNCLKFGILNADIITTVSPNYAKEILSEQFGSGLEKHLQEKKRNLVGILNGLDENFFNPETDSYIVENYSIKNLELKIKNKTYLQKITFGEASIELPVISIVSRLAKQKGIDLIIEGFPSLAKENIRFIILGEGDEKYEKFFKEMMLKFPEKCWAKIGFDERLAHQIYAGSDIFLMPSLFEPCGLGQQVAMKYGTVPVARAVGGIKDTVLPVMIYPEAIEGSGFVFEGYNTKEFIGSLKEALNLYERKDSWRAIQLNGMSQDFSWRKSAQKYSEVYKDLMEN